MTYTEHTRALPTLRRKAAKRLVAKTIDVRETLRTDCFHCGKSGHAPGRCALREEGVA